MELDTTASLIKSIATSATFHEPYVFIEIPMAEGSSALMRLSLNTSTQKITINVCDGGNTLKYTGIFGPGMSEIFKH
jgi:hypothetical protein